MNEMHKIKHVKFAAMEGECNKVVKGYPSVIQLCIRSLITNDHVLLTSVPGLAKTTLANTIGATIIGGKAGRIQLLPDTQPSDITGIPVFNQETRQWEIELGPIVGVNIFLADEVNRTGPKTNAAMLQAMQERKVTIRGKDYKLEQVFIVIATRNPIEQEGTYELPEAMIDRFGAEVSLPYVDADAEQEILRMATSLRKDPTSLVNRVVSLEDIVEARAEVAKIVDQLPADIISYINRIGRATRPVDDLFKKVIDKQGNDFSKKVLLGCSPRAQQAIAFAAAATAFLNGRSQVEPDDIKFVARDILRARITKNPMAAKFQVDDFVTALLDSVDVNAGK